MKIEAFKKGDYIYEKLDSGREFINLITHDYTYDNNVLTYLEKGENFNPCGNSRIRFNENTRYATPEEISWLDACIKADKYIPFEEISWLDACIKADKYIPFEEINIEPQYEVY